MEDLGQTQRRNCCEYGSSCSCSSSMGINHPLGTFRVQSSENQKITQKYRSFERVSMIVIQTVEVNIQSKSIQLFSRVSQLSVMEYEYNFNIR